MSERHGAGERVETPPRTVAFRTGLFLGAALAVGTAIALYALVSRGLFEEAQRLVLVAENAEGVSVGADLLLAGFPIGRVHRIVLGEDGRARIEVRIPRREARWLRESSVFTLERGIVGGARLRAYTTDLEAAPLPDGVERRILRGDATEEYPRMLASARATLENVERLTSPEGPIGRNLENLERLTARFAGRYGILGAVVGSDEEAARILAAVERAQGLLGALAQAAARAESLAAAAEARLFGDAGTAAEVERALAQLGRLAEEARATVTEARARLAQLEPVLADAQAIAANARTASVDLAALRAEVEASLRRLGALIEEIDRRWPFERDTSIRLP